MNIRVLQTLVSAYARQANQSVLSPRGDGQVRLVYAKALNHSGGAIDLGLLRKLGSAGSAYNISTLVSTTLLDVTKLFPTAQTLFTTTNNDGFLVGAKEKFGLVGFIVSQSQSGAPVYTYQYWNGASFATLTTIAVPASYTSSATVENLIVFLPPIDWVPGGTIAGVVGINQNQYNILVRATTAPGTAVQATSAWVGAWLDYLPSAADKTALEWNCKSLELALKFNSGDALMPYFGSANAANAVMSQFWVQDQ